LQIHYVVAALLAPLAANAQVVWKGDFDTGAASLKGNCTAGQNQWCEEQTIRPQQIQIVQTPTPAQGTYAARIEVKYGDTYSTYSDERTLITPSLSMWEDEGNDRWYRWQVLWPDDWVGDYPKWDELAYPSSRSPAGSVVEWHHDANGQVETGSAPIYIGANNTDITICLVDQATSTCREVIKLTPLLRNHWHDFVMHAKWSSNPSVGFLEMWIDGVNVLPRHPGANMYPGMRNYLSVGLYRNGHIGDPNLIWPAGTPLAGTHVYGTDGTPGVVYIDGFIAGKTRAAVEPPSPPPASPSPTDSGTFTPTPATPTPTTSAGVGASFLGAGGGCASSGPHTAWLAVPLVGLLALRRRRRA
jgi:uncharacterized protein (TIGR03382 family)